MAHFPQQSIQPHGTSSKAEMAFGGRSSETRRSRRAIGRCRLYASLGMEACGLVSEGGSRMRLTSLSAQRRPAETFARLDGSQRGLVSRGADSVQPSSAGLGSGDALERESQAPAAKVALDTVAVPSF